MIDTKKPNDLNLSKLPNHLWVLLIFVVSALMSNNSGAQTPEEKGLIIAKAIVARDQGWGDSQSELTMILRNKKGQEVVREMHSKSLEVESDGDKRLTVFNTPLNVKGTVFLSYSHIVGNDDQWLFLPTLKRVKRIASKNKSGPFLGSEFAFEDLSSFEVEKNSYLHLRDENYNGMAVSVVEMYPVDKYSGYARLVAWVDNEHYRVHKIDFYDRRNTLLKTLTSKGFRLHKEKYWRADKQFMVNHRSGKSTDIEIKNLRFGTGLTDMDFNENRLARAH